MRGMARGKPFATLHDPRLREAAIRRQLDGGKTAREAHADVLAGRLRDGAGELLPASDVPLKTVRDWATRARRERRAETVAASPAAETLRDGTALLHAAWLAECEAIRTAQRRGALKPERLAAAAKAGRELAQLVKASTAAQDPGNGSADPRAREGDGSSPAADDFVGSLAAEGAAAA